MAGSTAARRTAAQRPAPRPQQRERRPSLCPGVRPVREAASLQPPAAIQIALRARLRILIRIHLQFGGTPKFSRRRRTYALCQHSTQQAQTRMSRYANVGVIEREKSCVRTRYAPIRTARALRNHPISSSAPMKTGTELAEAIRSDSLCRDGQPNREPAWASPREMVLAGPPRPSRSASATRGLFTRNPIFHEVPFCILT